MRIGQEGGGICIHRTVPLENGLSRTIIVELDDTAIVRKSQRIFSAFWIFLSSLFVFRA
jgi:hypothetical protein